MSSRTQHKQSSSAQWLEALEARLNPPMADDEDFVDPFADLPEGTEEQVAKLRLMFNWQPAREKMH